MAITASRSFSLIEAAKYGVDFVDLFLSEFGADSTIYADAANIFYSLEPGFAPAAVQIHPLSAIDRCMIGCTYPGNGFNTSVLESYRPERVIVTVDQPFLATAPALTASPLRIIAEPTAQYSSTYQPYTVGSDASFNVSALIKPWLGLRLWRKPPPAAAFKRLNMDYSVPGGFTYVGAVNSPPAFDVTTTEVLGLIVPVHGRQSVRVELPGNTVNTMTYRIGAVYRGRERILGSYQVGANGLEVVTLAKSHGDYITLYGTISAGTARVSPRIIASDVSIGVGVL